MASPLDTFDHVVVLMLENRSFDNLLGYMYPNGVPASAPLGKTFEGVTGKNLSNPIPNGVKNPPPSGATTIALSPVDNGNYFQPYPDPGEDYCHVNTQLFGVINGGESPPYNLPSGPLPQPGMQGFVTDYIENYKQNEFKGVDPQYDTPSPNFRWDTGYKQIMQCYPTSSVPVVTTLATEFGVFDHWFCAVPSETWCNRAFWNAGTSWGYVINAPESDAKREFWWTIYSAGQTIFNQITDSGAASLTWKIYTPNLASATAIIHAGALADYHDQIFTFKEFLSDCASDSLPAYSFVEPYFFTPQNDMHPSTPKAWGDGSGPGDVGPVLLGELLVWNVYDAIRKSPGRDRTLLIITFDEHGGCYDHVPPPGQVTPPGTDGWPEDDFDFKRLGVRIPTIMISSHIASNTVVNTPMHHGSFMNTVRKKWDKIAQGRFPPLTARVGDAPDFSEVFTSATPRQWPEIPKPVIPGEFWARDFSRAPLSKLQRSIVDGLAMLPETKEANRAGLVSLDTRTIKTNGQALQYLKSIPGLGPEEPPSMFK